MNKAVLKELVFPSPPGPTRSGTAVSLESQPKACLYFEESSGNGVTHFLADDQSLDLFYKDQPVTLTLLNLNGLRIVDSQGKEIFYNDGWELGDEMKAMLWLWVQDDDFEVP
jgi:hypothetical protein